MATTVSSIEHRPSRSGALRAYIAGTRVRVQDVYALAEIQGRSPDEIVRSLPHLTLGQVHAALSYYFDHREEILAEMREDREFVSQVRAATGAGPLESKLGAPHDDDDSIPSR